MFVQSFFSSGSSYRHQQFQFRPLVMLASAVMIVVLCGCAATGTPANTVDYGNPFYKHVRHLPENQLQAENAFQPAAMDTRISAAALEQQGDRLMRSGRLAQAYAAYEQALAKAPDKQELQVKMARALSRGGLQDDALKLIQPVITHPPVSGSAWEVMGMIHYEKEQFPEALSFFNQALAADARLWQSLNFQGLIYDLQNSHAQAAQAFRKAIALNPGQGFLHNNLGVSLALAGHHAAAATAFRKAIRLKYATDKVYNNLGSSLAAMERYAEALETFKYAVGEARAWNNMGCIYMSSGQYEAAIQCFEKAIAMTPHFYTVAYNNLKKAEMAIH